MEQELPQFELTVHHHDEVATLCLRGELDLHAADQVRAVAAGLLDEGVRRIEIDAGELTFVDSSGIKALLDVRHDAGERDVEVAVVAASERLRWVAQLTGLDGLLPTSG
jgi:stage II sporulation protein AA (anti-sigma F factor antagonist)